MSLGAIVFAQGSYTETVIAERNDVQLVDCSDAGENKLYRVETAGPGPYRHDVAYDLDAARQLLSGFHEGART